MGLEMELFESGDLMESLDIAEIDLDFLAQYEGGRYEDDQRYICESFKVIKRWMNVLYLIKKRKVLISWAQGQVFSADEEVTLRELHLIEEWMRE